MNAELLSIRLATEQDASEILAIYAPYVTGTAITFEYEVPSLEEFTRRIQRTLLRYPYLVACSGDSIVGYAYVSPFHERPAYSWAAETSIYVSMESRGRGIGHTLYALLERCWQKQNILNPQRLHCYPQPGQHRLPRTSGIPDRCALSQLRLQNGPLVRHGLDGKIYWRASP